MDSASPLTVRGERRKTLRVLIVEDDDAQAFELVENVSKAGYQVTWKRVSKWDELEQALRQEHWDVVLVAQHTLTFSAKEAIPRIIGLGFDGPLLVISGGQPLPKEVPITSLGVQSHAVGPEEEVAELMRAGAHDYIRRGRLTRLVPVIEREIERAHLRAQHRRTLEALCQSEERYRTLWECSPDPILIVDRSGLIAFCNQAAYYTFGYHPEELEGLSLQKLIDVPVEELEQAVVSTGSGKPKQNRWHGFHKSGRELELLVTVAEVPIGDSNYFVLFVRDMTDYKQTIQILEAKKQELEIARRIQKSFLPTQPLGLTGLVAFGTSFPAEETGGDLYDCFLVQNGRLVLVIGDVSGHGMGPALVMAEVHACLRLAARFDQDPARILSCVHAALADDLIKTGRLVTALLLVFEPDTKQLWYCNAGHPKGYVFDAHGAVKHVLSETGRPLGLFKSYTCRSKGPIVLEEGDLVFLCTDGLTETISPDGTLLGEERVIKYVQEHIHQSCEEIINGLYGEAASFRSSIPQIDDITIAMLKLTPIHRRD